MIIYIYKQQSHYKNHKELFNQESNRINQSKKLIILTA
jgi:hypothetical protein